MLLLFYSNVGKREAFKNAMSCLSKKLSENGFASSVSFNGTFSVATIHLPTFKNSSLLGSTLNMIHSMLSLIALDIDNFDSKNLYPDSVNFSKNV